MRDTAKLRELHDMVKEHPYRVNQEEGFKDSYRKLLCLFSTEAYAVFKEHPKYKGAVNMIHDFNAAIGSLFYKYVQWSHLESCIQCVHKFLDTGDMLEYFTNYHGVPRRYVFDEEDGKYHGIFTVKECDERIDKYRKSIADAYAKSEEEGKKRESWDGDSLKYWEENKAWTLKRLEK